MQSHPKRTISHSLLPPEVWICIFHHATDVPGTLIPDIYAHTTLIGPVYNKRYHPDLRKALITKRALVRVCKQWWHLAIPFLYQSVYIGLTRCLASLSRTLADSATGKGTIVSTRPLGEYTERLDVAIRDRSEDADVETGHLSRIIKQMPHLAIAVFAPTTWHTDRTDTVDSIIDALRHSARSLRVLDWSSDPLQPTSLLLTELLAKCIQLRVLHCPFLVWSKLLEHEDILGTVSTLRQRSIHSGETHNSIFRHSDLDPARRSRCPALQELIVDLCLNHSHWADLVRVYGPQLVSVHFYVPQVASFNIGPHMELLAQSCPGLRRFTITSELCFESFDPTFVLPLVTYLGVNATWSQSKKQDFKEFFVMLEKLTLRISSLRVVQLLNETHLKCFLNLQTKFVVRVLQPFMEAPPFRIEDREGVLLTGLGFSVSMGLCSD